jgi:hypothetical protein
MELRGSQPATNRTPTTLFTALGNFDSIKHLLSDKPLQRPNRTRPVEPEDAG